MQEIKLQWMEFKKYNFTIFLEGLPDYELTVLHVIKGDKDVSITLLSEEAIKMVEVFELLIMPLVDDE